jgi:hypothetical protein
MNSSHCCSRRFFEGRTSKLQLRAEEGVGLMPRTLAGVKGEFAALVAFGDP